MPETGNNPAFFRDKEYYKVNHEEINISIQVSLDGFSFCAFHQPQNRLTGFLYTPARISSETLLAQRFTDWLQTVEQEFSPLKKFTLIYFTDKFTLLPYTFKGAGNQVIFEQLFDNITENEIIANPVELAELDILFYVQPNFLRIARFEYDIEFVHPVKMCIEEIMKSGEPDAFFVLFDAKGFFICGQKNKNLVLANYFSFSHYNDVVYYLLNIVKKTGLNPQLVHLVLSGNITVLDPAYTLLKGIFPKISFYYPSRKIDVDNDFPTSVFHRFFTHFVSCE